MAKGPAGARDAVRRFALGLPGAVEEFPWGESVVKVNRKVFVFLGSGDSTRPPLITVKLRDEAVHAHALTVAGAEPAGYGLGRSGWVSVPLTGGGTPAGELLCEWVEESYRVIAPKRLVADLDGE
ncbi:MmcQ/YjbR family DNA-binding protein [Streptomyces meridianus]|uniref:MmcQ/YjbR family DNA-binding protein n=1 Tax=Streptomyces meridianus TaxID=2938945 RepID=A0ABT0XBV2_9ACTN|nr:MmcQ/YjbR family DNA-binding protein [Streptomyces meridianus]MCM2579997.1 MmcQ/YjbR family DNA-binding protein [Streptomyces meridianus]